MVIEYWILFVIWNLRFGILNVKLMVKKIFLVGIIFLSLPIFVEADQWGQKVNFFVDPAFDISQREELSATLQAPTIKLYFYIDDAWWNSLTGSQQDEVRKSLNSLASEFESKIYPFLTSAFGFEDKPGIDKDEKITVLIHPMVDMAGGYFNTADGYSKLEAPFSNQREMVYLNSKYINSSQNAALLAHEFMHLITLNQKEKKYKATEEVWLNEVRSEYAPTFLGYDDKYQGSNLERRVGHFLSDPTNSLTDWRNDSGDYGATNLFSQYLVDQYGVEILKDSLQTPKVGIDSLNYALEKNRASENFSQVFTNWTIANLINDCSIGERYCYKNTNLKDFRVVPLTNYLPLVGESSLKFGNATQSWSGNWHKFIGGNGKLTLEFAGSLDVSFQVPYITKTIAEATSVKFLELNQLQQGVLTLSNFGKDIISLTIIPTIQAEDKRVDNAEPYFIFSWTASVTKETNQNSENPPAEKPVSEMTKAELEAKIMEIQQQIIALLTQLIELLQSQIADLR